MTEQNPCGSSGPGLPIIAAALQHHLSFDPTPPLTAATAWSPYTDTHRFWNATFRELPGLQRTTQSILGEPFKEATSHPQWTAAGLEGVWPDLPAALLAIQQALGHSPLPRPSTIATEPLQPPPSVPTEHVCTEIEPTDPPLLPEADISSPAFVSPRPPLADEHASPPQLSLFG